jgi:hypothetical protein
MVRVTEEKPTSAVPHTISPDQYIQPTAGISTKPGPIWARHKMNITAVSTVAEGDPNHRQTDATEQALRDRRHDHAQGHAPDRLAGQPGRGLAAVPSQTAGKTDHAGGGSLTPGEQDCGDNHDEKKLQEQQSETANCASEPSRHIPGIWRQLRHQIASSAAYDRLFAAFERRRKGRPVGRTLMRED